MVTCGICHGTGKRKNREWLDCPVCGGGGELHDENLFAAPKEEFSEAELPDPETPEDSLDPEAT